MAVPKVSVIVPVYNGERFLRDTLQSVVEQSYQDFEVVVADDGSTDRTAQIVHEFSLPISYHRQENQGAGMARNLGVSVATGEWIAFLDADDVWYPDKLTVQMEHAEKLPDVDVFYTDMDVIEENGNLKHQGFLIAKAGRARKRKRQGLVSLAFRGAPFPYPSTVIMKKEVFLKSGGFCPLFRGNYHEDFEFFTRVAHNFRLYFIPQSLVKYRLAHTQDSPHGQVERQNWLIFLNRLWEFWADDPQKQTVLLRYYAKHYTNLGNEYLVSDQYQKARKHFQLAFSYRPLCLRNIRYWLISYMPGVRHFYTVYATKHPKKSN